MKTILFFLFPVLAGITSYAQIQTGISYSVAIPHGRMSENINLTHSGVFDVFYKFPKISKLRTGIQFGWGTYAHRKENQHYEFRDGSSTDVKVTFSSNIFNGHLGASYDLLSDAKVVPYVTAKAGLSTFYTKIMIPDPDDAGSCKPLENKNMYKDATWSAGGGIGARMNANKIFKNNTCDKFWFDLSLNYLTGGNVEYLNVKHLEHPSVVDQNEKEFKVRFVNITTSELHEHHVARVLNSRIRQLDVKLGLVMSLR